MSPPCMVLLELRPSSDFGIAAMPGATRDTPTRSPNGTARAGPLAAFRRRLGITGAVSVASGWAMNDP